MASPAKQPENKLAEITEALRPLAGIADAYDENGLDDEGRKFWGENDEHQNTTPPKNIELVQGRGGRRLLTLADCFRAREVLHHLRGVRDVLPSPAPTQQPVCDEARRFVEMVKDYTEASLSSADRLSEWAKQYGLERGYISFIRRESARILTLLDQQPPRVLDAIPDMAEVVRAMQMARDWLANVEQPFEEVSDRRRSVLPAGRSKGRAISQYNAILVAVDRGLALLRKRFESVLSAAKSPGRDDRSRVVRAGQAVQALEMARDLLRTDMSIPAFADKYGCKHNVDFCFADTLKALDLALTNMTGQSLLQPAPTQQPSDMSGLSLSFERIAELRAATNADINNRLSNAASRAVLHDLLELHRENARLRAFAEATSRIASNLADGARTALEKDQTK